MHKLRYHEAFHREVSKTVDWYLAHSDYSDPASDFLDKLRETVSAISAAPQIWPSDIDGNRSMPMGRYPFRIVYRIEGEFLSIIALSHAKRRPGYWQKRRFK